MCPLQSPGVSDNRADAYKSFFFYLEQFRAINVLPTIIYFGCDESAESFSAHCASQLKSCHLWYKIFGSKKKSNEAPALFYLKGEQVSIRQLA